MKADVCKVLYHGLNRGGAMYLLQTLIKEFAVKSFHFN